MPRPRKSTYGSEKPPYSYVALCAMAIQSSTTGMLTLNEIYRFIVNTFPFYKANPSKWRNSLRHNLSFNDCFVKMVCATSSGSKKSYWSLHPSCGNMFKDGSLLRRKKRFVMGSDIRGGDTWGPSYGHQEPVNGVRTYDKAPKLPYTAEKAGQHDLAYKSTSSKKTDFTIDNILKSTEKEEKMISERSIRYPDIDEFISKNSPTRYRDIDEFISKNRPNRYRDIDEVIARNSFIRHQDIAQVLSKNSSVRHRDMNYERFNNSQIDYDIALKQIQHDTPQPAMCQYFKNTCAKDNLTLCSCKCSPEISFRSPVVTDGCRHPRYEDVPFGSVCYNSPHPSCFTHAF